MCAHGSKHPEMVHGAQLARYASYRMFLTLLDRWTHTLKQIVHTPFYVSEPAPSRKRGSRCSGHGRTEYVCTIHIAPISSQSLRGPLVAHYACDYQSKAGLGMFAQNAF